MATGTFKFLLNYRATPHSTTKVPPERERVKSKSWRYSACEAEKEKQTQYKV